MDAAAQAPHHGRGPGNMSRISKRHKWVVPFLTVLLLSLLAGADVECDFEDGEFEFDVPSKLSHTS